MAAAVNDFRRQFFWFFFRLSRRVRCFSIRQPMRIIYNHFSSSFFCSPLVLEQNFSFLFKKKRT